MLSVMVFRKLFLNFCDIMATENNSLNLLVKTDHQLLFQLSRTKNIKTQLELNNINRYTKQINLSKPIGIIASGWGQKSQ